MLALIGMNHGAFRHLKLHGQQLVLTDLSDAYPTDAIITLKPIGPRRFRTNRGFDDIDLLFEHQADATRTTVRVEYSYGAKEKWGPIELVKLDDEQLADYLGKYYCDDMESVYRVSTADEILFIQFNYGRKRELLPTLTDSFHFHQRAFQWHSFRVFFVMSQTKLQDLTWNLVESNLCDLRNSKFPKKPSDSFIRWTY